MTKSEEKTRRDDALAYLRGIIKPSDTVYTSLSRSLFPEFYCIGEHCPSNDHMNGEYVKKGEKHSDGGYALRHAWL